MSVYILSPPNSNSIDLVLLSFEQHGNTLLISSHLPCDWSAMRHVAVMTSDLLLLGGEKTFSDGRFRSDQRDTKR